MKKPLSSASQKPHEIYIHAVAFHAFCNPMTAATLPRAPTADGPIIPFWTDQCSYIVTKKKLKPSAICRTIPVPAPAQAQIKK